MRLKPVACLAAVSALVACGESDKSRSAQFEDAGARPDMSSATTPPILMMDAAAISVPPSDDRKADVVSGDAADAASSRDAGASPDAGGNSACGACPPEQACDPVTQRCIGRDHPFVLDCAHLPTGGVCHGGPREVLLVTDHMGTVVMLDPQDGHFLGYLKRAHRRYGHDEEYGYQLMTQGPDQCLWTVSWEGQSALARGVERWNVDGTFRDNIIPRLKAATAFLKRVRSPLHASTFMSLRAVRSAASLSMASSIAKSSATSKLNLSLSWTTARSSPRAERCSTGDRTGALQRRS
jgi:hypothetical protein